MTPIDLLLSLDICPATIARRLQVSEKTVSRWRTKRNRPTAHHQQVATAYLTEIHNEIFSVVGQRALRVA